MLRALAEYSGHHYWQQLWFDPKSNSGNHNRRYLEIVLSPEEIKRAIQFYKYRSPEKIKEHEVAGRRIMEEYFEPVTREGVREFLGLPEGKYETYIYQKKNY